MATPEYARSDGNANHLIELFDAGRSQCRSRWLWRCVKCKREYASALRLTELTCIPNDPGIDYAAAPELLAAVELCLKTMAVVSPEGAIAVLGAHDAIAKAKGELWLI